MLLRDLPEMQGTLAGHLPQRPSAVLSAEVSRVRVEVVVEKEIRGQTV
jgi:hypothetical protein